MSQQKITSLIFVFLYSLSLSLLVAAQTPQKNANAATATVSGRVTLKGGTTRNALVYLQPYNSPVRRDPNAISRARTDESGQFRITGIEAGAYNVIALAPGYTTPDLSMQGPRGKRLNLSAGETVENVDIELVRGGVIAGRVTDSQGRALVEERITLHKLDKNGRIQPNFNLFQLGYEMFQTDDRGHYRIYGLPEGRYLVSIGTTSTGSMARDGGGAYYTRVFHPDVASESEAKIIEVTEGSESEDIDITVAEAVSTRAVSGRVVDADTLQPVSGIEVTFGAIYGAGSQIIPWGGEGNRSKASGEFHLKGLLPRKYAVFARGAIDSDFYSEPVICDLGGGDVSGVEVRVRRGGSISGVVVIEGTNDPKELVKLSRLYLGVSLSQSQLSAPRMDNLKVNADGSFFVRGLQPGRAHISYFPQPDARGFYLARVEHKGAPVREWIDIGAGEHVTGVRVVLAYGTHALRGELKIIGGELPAGQRFYVGARRIDDSPQTPQTFTASLGAEADARGRFVIENIPPGAYEVTARPIFNNSPEQVDQRIMRAFSTARERVLVNSSTQSVTLVIDLSRKEENQ